MIRYQKCTVLVRKDGLKILRHKRRNLEDVYSGVLRGAHRLDVRGPESNGVQGTHERVPDTGSLHKRVKPESSGFSSGLCFNELELKHTHACTRAPPLPHTKADKIRSDSGLRVYYHCKQIYYRRLFSVCAAIER